MDILCQFFLHASCKICTDQGLDQNGYGMFDIAKFKSNAMIQVICSALFLLSFAKLKALLACDHLRNPHLGHGGSLRTCWDPGAMWSSASWCAACWSPHPNPDAERPHLWHWIDMGLLENPWTSGSFKPGESPLSPMIIFQKKIFNLKPRLGHAWELVDVLAVLQQIWIIHLDGAHIGLEVHHVHGIETH